ncbi:MAG: archease, partial [Candidatus Nealsonbacteria bacterium CG09_land_8_20_14_0_10_42_14]
MKKYEILEHKADLKIRIFGKDKKELFFNALLAMSESTKAETSKPEKKVKRKIEIKSGDLATLLVDFLSEALYLSQVQKEVFSDIIIKKFTDKE